MGKMKLKAMWDLLDKVRCEVLEYNESDAWCYSGEYEGCGDWGDIPENRVSDYLAYREGESDEETPDLEPCLARFRDVKIRANAVVLEMGRREAYENYIQLTQNRKIYEEWELEEFSDELGILSYASVDLYNLYCLN